MKVFISWSGSVSHKIAEAFRDWIPNVIQVAKPYLSSKDVEKGARWFSEIAGELEKSQIGIIILTRENTESPWILFEAGALSKSIEKSRVCPILFGISTSDITDPLARFQATIFNKDEILKLVQTINQALDESKLSDKVLHDAFDAFWPKLQEQVEKALKAAEDISEEPKEIRSEREIMEEVLNLIRDMRSDRDTLEEILNFIKYFTARQESIQQKTAWWGPPEGGLMYKVGYIPP